MNEDNLRKINKIGLEINEIDSFIHNYYKKPRSIKLAAFKQNFIFSLKVPGYGFLSETEYKLPKDLNDQILKLVRIYRDELVAEQEKLWGGK